MNLLICFLTVFLFRFEFRDKHQKIRYFLVPILILCYPVRCGIAFSGRRFSHERLYFRCFLRYHPANPRWKGGHLRSDRPSHRQGQKLPPRGPGPLPRLKLRRFSLSPRRKPRRPPRPRLAGTGISAATGRRGAEGRDACGPQEMSMGMLI